MTAEALVANNLTIRTPDGRAIVDSVSLTLSPGEIVGLTGCSGAGKSVLAYGLLGLARMPLRFDGGSVLIAGEELIGTTDAQARRLRGRRVALVTQNPRGALHPMVPIGRQIGRIWRAHHGGKRSSAAARAIEMLRLVGINDAERRANAFVQELSGGMAQRVLIAAALVANPSVLIADEPTSGLDVTVQAAFLDMMAAAARTQGTAMLLISQEPAILANYCDRVLTMAGGRLVSDQTVGTYFASWSDSRRAPLKPVVAPNVVVVRGLTKTFPVRGSRQVIHAVDGLDLTVRKGETLGLVGESGSGKTTAGRALVRLVEPDGGEVRIEDVALATLGRHAMQALRAKVQFVRQDPFDSFNPRWTVARSVAEPLQAQHGRSTPVAPRVAQVLAMAGCGDVAASRPGGLSAGTLQQVAIARALATAPSVIVLDEPTSVLAPEPRRQLVELLSTLQAETGVALLFISHDLTTIARISHRIAVMYLGQLVETGDTAQIFSQPRHPYTRALIAAQLWVDPSRRRIDHPVLERLTGEIPSPIDLPPGCYLASRCRYALPRCEAERQPLINDALGAVRCWRAGELPPFELAAV